jgi:triacylglycerol lipase
VTIEYDAKTVKYSANNAYMAANAARFAYQNRDDIKAASEKWGFDKFHFFDNNETQAFIAGNSELIILAFRGTEPSKLKDVLADADVFKIEELGGRIHKGFYKALQFVWEDVSQKIAEFQDNSQSILISGHSLGAALATLAAAQLQQDKGILANSIYTFGSPRVGDETFRENYDAIFTKRHFRFVNNNDVVTRVAPSFPPFNYHHVGEMLYFDVDGVLHSDISFWNKFKETIKGGIDDFLAPGLDLIKDHDMQAYQDNVKKNINKAIG